MEPRPNTYWKHKPWYVKMPQSAMDGLIDKSGIWMPRGKSDKFKKFVKNQRELTLSPIASKTSPLFIEYEYFI